MGGIACQRPALQMCIKDTRVDGTFMSCLLSAGLQCCLADQAAC